MNCCPLALSAECSTKASFDGQRYGEYRPQRRTKSRHDWRFNKDSCERAIAAHALAAAGVLDADLVRHEKPDFLCSLESAPRFGLEVAELHRPDHAAFENNTTTIALGVLDAIDEPLRDERLKGVQCTIKLGCSPSSRDARSIRNELIAWIDADLATTPEGQVTFDPIRYPLVARHDPFCVLKRGAARWFTVSLPARAYDPEEIASVALSVLSDKREKQYAIETPWLILGVTDRWGEYSASMELLRNVRDQIEIEPFRKVIFQYEGAVVILGEDPRITPKPSAIERS
jgi:hypothetical protein